MYRLVKVSVNAAGRFGAPETEPGPSGMAAADELMMIPSHQWSCLTIAHPAGASRP
jgi:hypothetical protein